MHDYIVEIEDQSVAVITTAVDSDIIELEIVTSTLIDNDLTPEVIEVIEVGPQGAAGLPGTPGATGPAGPSNLLVQETDPGLAQPGLWVQTFPNGDITFWIEDGS